MNYMKSQAVLDYYNFHIDRKYYTDWDIFGMIFPLMKSKEIWYNIKEVMDQSDDYEFIEPSAFIDLVYDMIKENE